LTIAGQTVTISQLVPTTCTFFVTPTSVSVDAIGGSRTITVDSYPFSCNWSAQSNAAFIAITRRGGAEFGWQDFSIKPNGGPDRTGTLTIAQRTVTVRQSAPLPPITINTGCPGAGQSPSGNTSIQFINLLDEEITVFRPGTTEPGRLPAQSGYTQQTQVGTVWQVRTGTQPCVASFTATAQAGSAIVRP
jgi:hypothetical protein